MGSQWQCKSSAGNQIIGHRADRVQKWWSSGAGDPRCKIYIVMCKSSPNNKDPYKQQSVILVPADTKGITIH